MKSAAVRGAEPGGGTRRKPVVLVLMMYYLPAFKSGGPVRTIANAIAQLGDVFTFRVLARDRDMGDEGPYPDVVPDTWQARGKAEVMYTEVSVRRVRTMMEVIARTPCDLLYINGFFDPYFSIAPLLSMRLGLLTARPVVLAPRGEMAPSALAQKAGKKRLYIAFSKLLGLHRRVVWQASSLYEKADIVRRLGVDERRVVVAPNFPSLGGLEGTFPKPPPTPLRVAFLARIAPVKNLPFALEALRGVDRDVEFNVYGTVEDRAYFERCRALMEGVGGRVRATYHGVCPPGDVSRVLAAHHLLFLPTKGENFGHAIAEALAVGTPVLISDRTPWRSLAAEGAGWDLPLDDPRPFADRIEAYADMDEGKRAALRASTLRFAAARLQDPAVRAQNVALFEAALGQGAA